MFTFSDSALHSIRVGRRGFLQIGALGIGGLGLAQLLQLRAANAAPAKRQGSVIMVYLHGGPPHMGMFDMKPEAPAEIRGEFAPTRTNVSGLEICELMPKLATIADKYAVIRNITFNEYLLGHNLGGRIRSGRYIQFPTYSSSLNSPSSGHVDAPAHKKRPHDGRTINALWTALLHAAGKKVDGFNLDVAPAGIDRAGPLAEILA